jgi:hypothetical protein
MTNGTRGPGGHTQAEKDAAVAAQEASGERRVKRHYTGTKLALDTLSQDDFRYILQHCNNQIITTEAVTPSGPLTMQQRFNNAWQQGGSPGPDPDTQPGVSVSGFNLSGYPIYTPPARIAAFVTEVNAWVATNLHQGGQEGGEDKKPRRRR